MESKPIQKYPGGLLDFLQIKNAGKNPNVLPDTLQGQIDLREWMLQSYAEAVAGGNAVISAAGITNYITVPDNEYWWVWDVAATVTLDTSATISLMPIHRVSPAGGSAGFAMPLCQRVDWDEATQGAACVVIMTHPPFLLQPGGVMGIRVTELSAATTTGNVIARITRMKA